MEYLWCGLNWWSQVTREPSRIGDFQISRCWRSASEILERERGEGRRGTFLLFESSRFREKLSALPRRGRTLTFAWKTDPKSVKTGSRSASFQAPVILSWDGIRGRRGKEMRLKSVVRSSVDRSELNYEEMLEFWSSLPIFLPFFLSFFRDYKVENDANIFVK